MTFLNKIKARIVDKFSGGADTQEIGKQLDSLVSEDRDYALKHLPKHMVEAGRWEQLYRWLMNFDFIKAKVDRPNTKIQELIEDYELACDLDILLIEDRHKNLSLIQGSLRLSAHILDRDKTQLAGQFLGRLQHFENADIQALLKQVKRREKDRYLCPLTASLTPPGGHLFRTFVGHFGAVNAVAIAPDGKQFVSASSDKTIIIWDWDNGDKKFILTGHTAPVNAVGITPDGKRLISAARDKTIKVWNLENGKDLFTFNDRHPLTNTIAVTSDGTTVISPILDTLKIRNLDSEEMALNRESFSDESSDRKSSTIAISVDGKWAISSSFSSSWVYIPEAPQLAQETWHNNVKLWDLKTKKVKFHFIEESFANLFKTLAISPDGLHAIAGSSDSEIEVFKLKTEREVVQNSFSYWLWCCFNDLSDYKFLEPAFVLNGHKSSIETLAVTSDSKRLISGSKDNTIKVWSLETATELFTFSGHSDRINSIAIFPNDKWAISGSSDCTIKVWNLEIDEQDAIFYGHRDSVNSVVITSDGKRAISSSNAGDLIVWELETRTIVRAVQNLKVPASHLALRPETEQLIYSDRNGTIKLCSLKNDRPIFTTIEQAKLAHLFALSPDGNLSIVLRKDGYCRFVTLHRDRTSFQNSPDLFIKLKIENDSFKISAETRVVVIRLFQKEKRISINRRHQWILASIAKISLYTLFLKDEDNLFRLITYTAILPMLWFFPIQILSILYSQIHSMRSLSVAAIIVLTIAYAIYFVAVTVLDFNLQRSQVNNGINCMAITPNSQYLIFGTSDYTLKVFDRETREQRSELIGHCGSVETVAVASNGQFIVSGSTDKTIKVWSLETHEHLFTLVGHSDTVNNAIVTPDSQRIISTSFDNSLKVWDLNTQKAIATFTGDSRIDCCAIAPDGVTIVAGESSGRLHFLRLEDLTSSQPIQN